MNTLLKSGLTAVLAGVLLSAILLTPVAIGLATLSQP